jgi:sigma-B regulation protein RsbU (phosphoserine phosphatase)
MADLSPLPTPPLVTGSRSTLADGNAAPAAAEPSTEEPRASAPRLSLTDFLDLGTLQEIQDSFTAVSRLHAIIRDADGQPLTLVTDAARRAQSDLVLEQLLTADETADGPFVAPIIVEGQELGSIAIDRPQAEGLSPGSSPGTSPGTSPESSPASDGEGNATVTRREARALLRRVAKRLHIPAEAARPFIEAAEAAYSPNRAAGIQFLYLLANSIARLCYQEYHLRQRVEELSALYKLSTLLSASRDVQQTLDTAARSAAEVMKVKAVAIRLLDTEKQEMVPKAVCNLSEAYVNKGSIEVQRSPMFRDALAGKVVYIENMATDPRILYPEDAQREGLVSVLCAGMIYQGRPIGAIQCFTGEVRRFTQFEVNLLRALAQLLAAAIENARLDTERQESLRMQRQLHLAADVQRRMLPAVMPKLPPFDIAARYVPSFELGGDFYDFIDLDGHLGIAVGDVVGKGVAASLLMASVRSSLRAYAQDVYNLNEVIQRVNVQLTRDTLDNEFVTLFYGVLNPKTRRLTYCSAGHEPPLLLRKDRLIRLETGGMIVGIDVQQTYDMGICDLEPNDLLLIYTDGLPDAMNFSGEKFGRPRIEKAMRTAADRSAHDALNHILWEMRRFAGLKRSFDDTTLVVVKVGR